MVDLFICKIHYLGAEPNGCIVQKKEEYVVGVSEGELVEDNLGGIMNEFIPEFNMITCSKKNISDVWVNHSGEWYFNAKVCYLGFDSDSGKEQIKKQNILVQANNIPEVIHQVEENMGQSIVEWEITGITKTNVVEVFIDKDEKSGTNDKNQNN